MEPSHFEAKVKVALLTREYPPEVYGGAGTHVEYLTRELRRLTEVSVHCWGAPRDEPGVTSHEPWSALTDPKPEAAALEAMSINLAMAAATKNVDLVHSHTWYANFGGHLSKLMWSIPHVLTTHSLEPLRPWKAEQLGGGYVLSTFCEQTAIEAADAVIAVSQGMRDDVKIVSGRPCDSIFVAGGQRGPRRTGGQGGTGGWTEVLVTEPSHPFIANWWPPGHILGWEHTFVHEIAHLLDAIANDRPVGPLGATFEDGYRNALISDAILESAAAGRRVEIS